MKDNKKKTKTTRSKKKLSSSLPKQDNNIISNIRIPRPIGVTLLARQYRKDNNTNTLSNLHNKIIGQYIQSGFKVCGFDLTVSQLADYLNMSLKDLMKKVHQQIQLISGLSDGKRMEELASAVIFMGFNGHLQARHIAHNQAVMLLNAQDNKYVPFLTGAANGAIANLLNADKNMINLYNALTGKGGNNININNQNLVQNNEYLTTSEAVRILSEKGNNGLLRKPEMKAELAQAYQNLEMPEVIATKQQGYTKDPMPMIPTLSVQLPNMTHIDRNEIDGDLGIGSGLLD